MPDDPPRIRTIDTPTIVIIVLALGSPIVFWSWHAWSSVDGVAKDKFVSEMTCPADRVTATRRKDLSARDLAPKYTPPTQPSDVASDPARLDLWNSQHPAPRINDGLQVIELEGCGHHVLWACERGKKLLHCEYKRNLDSTSK